MGRVGRTLVSPTCNLQLVETTYCQDPCSPCYIGGILSLKFGRCTAGSPSSNRPLYLIVVQNDSCHAAIQTPLANNPKGTFINVGPNIKFFMAGDHASKATSYQSFRVATNAAVLPAYRSSYHTSGVIFIIGRTTLTSGPLFSVNQIRQESYNICRFLPRKVVLTDIS
jgi:hypothetical protein